MVKKNKTNWAGMLYLLVGSVIFAIIGMALPNTINMINYLPIDSAYGTFVSYFTSCLLFWLFFRDVNLRK